MKDHWMIADLHIHSRFAAACSKNISFDNLVKWAKVKGLHLLGTGDFTHPIWFNEIKEKMLEKNGFYYYKGFPFVISGEISFIYTKERGRRVHLVVLVPSIEVAEKINSYLDTLGRRDYDGRPIFGVSCEEFVKKMMEIDSQIEIIPAHIWTPWFGIFGSKSGFDSLAEAFGREVKHIHAIETGMSSDPAMNWKIKELDTKSIVSFSDSHSFWPFRLGREATIFRKTDSYADLIRQIRENDFLATIETDPGYGIYHWDGHRNCEFSCSPQKTRELGGICPKCDKKLTLGVEYRVEELSEPNRTGFKPEGSKSYYKILPLHEVIALVLNVKDLQSKRVWSEYNKLIEVFGNELEILLNTKKEEFISKNIDSKLAETILKNRDGKIKVKPGYDGLYGKAVLEDKQVTL